MELNVRLISPLGIPFTSLEKIHMPFDAKVWIIILITVLIATMLILYRFAHGCYSYFILEMWNAILGGAFHDRTTKFYIRTALAIWLISMLVIRTAYLGSLFNFLHNQIHGRPANTIERVIQHDYDLYSANAYSDILLAITPRIKKQYVHFFHTSYHLLKKNH